MNYLYRIVRYKWVYLGISVILVWLVMALVARMVYRDIEESLDLPLATTLGTYAAALEAGTVNSRAMGAAILFGLENTKAKQLATGSLPWNDAEVLSSLETLRKLYIADVVMLVNKQGITVAYSSTDKSRGTGVDFSFRPYFKMAMQGTANVYPAVGTINTNRGIYLAAPLRATNNPVSETIGVVVVKVGADKLDALLKTWTNGTAVLLSPQGVAFAASQDDWLFRVTGNITGNRVAELQASKQFGKVFDQKSPLPLPFSINATAANIDGKRYVMRSATLDWNDPEGDWTLVFLEGRAPWWTQLHLLGYVSLAGLFLTMGLFLFYSMVRNALLHKDMNSVLSDQVTVRKRAETQMLETVSLLNATLESARDAILVVDLNNVWILHNHKFIDLWHIPEEIISTKDDTAALLFVLEQLEHPQVFLDKVKELYATPEASSADIIQFKDGKIIERFSIPQRINGKVVGRVWSFYDVTENKLAEQQLNNLFAFNKTILDRSPAGIAVYSYNGLCVMANESYARAIGANAEDMPKHNIRNSESWRRNGLIDFANLAFESGEAVRRKIEGTTSFGKRAALECIFAPVDIMGVQHLLVITNDISEQIEAENALKESMRLLEEKELAKSRFLAAAGHDLTQPLAAANLFIDALRSTKPTSNQIQIIQRLDQAMLNFNGLLESLLNISKLDAGVIRPEFTSIFVADIFDWLEQNFAPQANEKRLGFKVHYPAKDEVAVYSDFALVKSALLNLVSNAIKFTAKGAILISARQRGKELLFQIWDTGIGIQNEQIEHIFDEFYQINNPQRDRTSGLGLGLAIAKRALSLLDRKISCRSQPGQGSVFSFCLPLDSSSGGGKRQETRAEIQQKVDGDLFAKGKRFVIVEDDALVAEATSTALTVLGAEVQWFNNAEEALLHAKSEQSDYYIVDYMLGGKLDGIQFVKQLRLNLGYAVKAVLVTGDTSPTFVRSVADFAWPVLHKPVNLSNLLDYLYAQEH